VPQAITYKQQSCRSIIGATPEGKKELVALADGLRESALSWKELLLDLKRRGLDVAPELAIADGALGFWKALGEVWGKTREQRCFEGLPALIASGTLDSAGSSLSAAPMSVLGIVEDSPVSRRLGIPSRNRCRTIANLPHRRSWSSRLNLTGDRTR
jgi:Transposase, Mutator family